FDDPFLAQQVRRSASTISLNNPLPSFRGDPAARLEERLSILANTRAGRWLRRAAGRCAGLLRGAGHRPLRAPPEVREDVYIHLIKKMSALANGSLAFDVGRVPMDIYRYRIVLTCDHISGRAMHFRCMSIWEDSLADMPAALRVPHPALSHFAHY